MDNVKLQEIIESHGKWLINRDNGSRANLRGADLRGADLCGANLCDADLCDADLCGANLCGANLRGANLCDADLCGANLCGANLRGANLRGADLPNKIIQVGPIGSRKSYTIYNIDNDVVQCGCWNDYKGGSLEDFIKRIDNVYEPDTQYGKEYRAVIEYFKLMQAMQSETKP
jgi:uncharacterized protein YjbI with pentapeptide repeats